MGKIASLITGKSPARKVVEDDTNLNLSPGQMSPPAVRRTASDRLLGKKKPVKESLIPDDADRISGTTTAPKATDNSEDNDSDPDMPELPGPDGMFPTATALVAPDVMPDLFKPLSPSKIPSARPADASRFDGPGEPEVVNPPGESALDTILNRDQEDAPEPATPAALPTSESVKNMLRSMGAAVEDLPVAIQKVEKGAPLAETLYVPREPVMTAPTRLPFVTEGASGGGDVLRGGEKMPDPGATDPGKTVSLFRDYIRP